MLKHYGVALFAILLTLTLNAQNPGDPEPREVPAEARGGVTTLAVTNVIPKYVDGSGTLGDSIIADSGSAIGIGTTNPGARLDVRDATSTNMLLRVFNSGTGGATMRYVAADGAPAQMQLTHHTDWTASIVGTLADGLQFRVRPTTGGAIGASEWALNNSTRMTITRAGNVGIGTTTPETELHVVMNSSSSPGGLLLQQAISTVNSPLLIFRKSRGTVASPSAIQAGDFLGTMYSEGFDGTSFVRTGAFMKFIANGTIGTGSIPTDISFATGSSGVGTERMRIMSDGKVGIGTGAPNATLHVVGNAQFDGTVTGTYIKAHYQDVAEWVPSKNDLAPGTVVVLDGGNSVMASLRPYDTSVAGVVSAQPGIILGEEGAEKEQVATTGRVRVKVDASRGPIAVGDLLVTSDKPGYAMRSTPVDVGGAQLHRPGTIVGKALEPLAGGHGEILVLLSLQ